MKLVQLQFSGSRRCETAYDNNNNGLLINTITCDNEILRK